MVKPEEKTAEKPSLEQPGSLSDITLSTAANDLQPSASFSTRKNPQCIPANTPPVFPGLRPRSSPHLIRLVTKGNAGQAPSQFLLRGQVGPALLYGHWICDHCKNVVQAEALARKRKIEKEGGGSA